MEMTSPHDSGHTWITSRIKKKLTCMEETSPISSGGFVPSFQTTARCCCRVTGLSQFQLGRSLCCSSCRWCSKWRSLPVLPACELLRCLGATAQTSFCGVGEVTSRAGRTDNSQDCSFGVRLQFSIKKTHLTSETKPIASYYSTAFLESGSSDIYRALLLSLDLTALLSICHVNETLSLYVSC